MPDCLICHGVLTKPKRGPMPVYCSKACAKTAEYRLRRLQRHLLANESAQRDARERMLGPFDLPDRAGRTAKARLSDLEAEHAKIEAELLDLLRTLEPAL